MKKNIFKLSIITVVMLMIAFVVGNEAKAAPLQNIPTKIVQPNGEEIQCFASGDEFFNWLHDANGLIIIQDKNTGYYSYAKEVNGKLAPTLNYVSQKSINDPNLNKAAIKAVTIDEIKIPKAEIDKKRSFREKYVNKSKAPNQGTLNNLVVFIKFKGEAEFTAKKSAFNDLFNSEVAGDNSMKNYYHEVSYNKLTIDSTIYPKTDSDVIVSYEDEHPRSYYQKKTETNPDGYDGDTEARDREHTLLENAIKAIEPQVPKTLNLDINNDGDVDNVCFIVTGSPEGWSDLIWPHRWALYTKEVKINDKLVYGYNFQMEKSVLETDGVGVLAHEMFHSLGAPDLYHYSHDGLNPVYTWDVMHFNFNPPQHMTAYMKYRYGKWIDSIPEITKDGTYTLNPLFKGENQVYKIRSPKSSTEYFVVEYRKPEGTFESSLTLKAYESQGVYDPNRSGIIVYRINTLADGKGNRNGPPDEVYVLRDGVTEKRKNGNILNAQLSKESGRTSIGGPEYPICLSDGTQTGIRITEVGSAGDTISFKVQLEKEAPTLPYMGWIDGPTEGNKIAGITDIHGWFVYGKEISKIEVLANGNVVGEATRGERKDVGQAYPGYDVSKAGFKYALDTTKLPKGPTTITIRATAADGTTKELPPRTVEVVDKVDEVLPYLAWVDTPEPGSVISGLTPIKGWFVYGNPIKKVEILVDGKVVGTAARSERKDVAEVFKGYEVAMAGFKYSLDTTKLENGKHTIVVKATGEDGTVGQLPEFTVEVKNETAPFIGWIDGPKDGSSAAGNVGISGWIIYGKEIDKVEVLVDSTVIGEANRTERKDVGTAYEGYDASQAGFNYLIDGKSLVEGSNIITIRATGVDGKTFEMKVEVIKTKSGVTQRTPEQKQVQIPDTKKLEIE